MSIVSTTKLENLGASIQIEEGESDKRYSVLITVPTNHLHRRMDNVTWAMAHTAIDALVALDSMVKPNTNQANLLSAAKGLLASIEVIDRRPIHAPPDEFMDLHEQMDLVETAIASIGGK